MKLKERMLLRKIENTYGGDFDEISKFVQYSGESRHIQSLDKLSLQTFDNVCTTIDEFFRDLPPFDYYEAFVYFAKKNKMSLAAKCFTEFYLSDSCNNINEIKGALTLCKDPSHLINSGLYKSLDTIFESDMGKYTYMLLLCHKNKLSSEDGKKFEEKLNSCSNKQYKCFYLFHTKKDEVLKQFKSYTEFLMFLKLSSLFSDEEERLLMVEELKNEIDKEEKDNNVKYKDALDAISISTKKIKNV